MKSILKVLFIFTVSKIHDTLSNWPGKRCIIRKENRNIFLRIQFPFDKNKFAYSMICYCSPYHDWSATILNDLSKMMIKTQKAWLSPTTFIAITKINIIFAFVCENDRLSEPFMSFQHIIRRNSSCFLMTSR